MAHIIISTYCTIKKFDLQEIEFYNNFNLKLLLHSNNIC